MNNTTYVRVQKITCVESSGKRFPLWRYDVREIAPGTTADLITRNRWYADFQVDDGFSPEANPLLAEMPPSAQIVSPIRNNISNGIKGRSFLTGFTLVEVMVGSVILMILIAGISSILALGGRLWGISGAQADISSSARNVLYRMSEELSQAGRSTLIISPAQDSITFQTPSSFTAGNINWGNQIQYSLGGINGRQLVRNQAGSASTAIGGDYITLLRFNWSGTDSIEIQLALSKQSAKGDILSMQLGSQVRLRN